MLCRLSIDQIRTSMVIRISVNCFRGMDFPHPIPEDFAVRNNSLNPFFRVAESDLERHRLQGHIPYDPRCTICARSKSTFHCRRRRENSLETRVQADFAFLTIRGKLVDKESEDTIKILIFTELATNCIVRKVTLPSKPLDLPGSRSRTSSLRNKNPST